MKDNLTACKFEEVSWADIRDKVRVVNMEFAKVIDDLNPASSLKLIRGSYLYGEKITALGEIRVPDKSGKLQNLSSTEVSSKLQEQLGYCPTPLILQLSNAAEVFVEGNRRIIPLNLFDPGALYGLFETIVPWTDCMIYPCWSVTAGARTAFLGPKITDAIGHGRLRKEFKIPGNAPKALHEQWEIFKAINARSAEPWRCEILLFTGDWFKERKNDINWLRFQNYLLKKAWVQSKNTRAKNEYSTLLESFSSAVNARHLKPSPYIVDTVMHLMFSANGAVPGFKPINGGEQNLPAKAIEDAYLNIYQLKQYAPIIMQPHMLQTTGTNSSVYYSLAYPTLLEGSPAIRNKPNVIAELRDVRVLMGTLRKVLAEQKSMISNFMDNIEFEYYHSDEDKFGELLNSKDIPKNDKFIGSCLEQKFKGKEFSPYGQFFRGCIRIFTKMTRLF